jgi:hypothetical protein
MFKLTPKEKAEVVANCDHLAALKFSPALPNAFTEHGAVMLASVLNSPVAVQASIRVVRAFIKLRELLGTQHKLALKLLQLEKRLGEHDEEIRSKDILGRVYEYFLGQFAASEGKKGGEFYTAQSVVKLLAEMIEPNKGRVFDPCCGSGGMLVQSEKFPEAHG